MIESYVIYMKTIRHVPFVLFVLFILIAGQFDTRSSTNGRRFLDLIDLWIYVHVTLYRTDRL